MMPHHQDLDTVPSMSVKHPRQYSPAMRVVAAADRAGKDPGRSALGGYAASAGRSRASEPRARLESSYLCGAGHRCAAVRAEGSSHDLQHQRKELSAIGTVNSRCRCQADGCRVEGSKPMRSRGRDLRRRAGFPGSASCGKVDHAGEVNSPREEDRTTDRLLPCCIRAGGTFPRNVRPPAWAKSMVEVVAGAETTISTVNEKTGLDSDAVLKEISAGLVALGYAVETGKTKAGTILRPVLFGENGVPEVNYEIDAFHD
jgi:hypothetical protein